MNRIGSTRLSALGKRERASRHRMKIAVRWGRGRVCMLRCSFEYLKGVLRLAKHHTIVQLFNRSFNQSFIQSFIHSLIHYFIKSLICLFIHTLFHSIIHLFNYLLIHLFKYIRFLQSSNNAVVSLSLLSRSRKVFEKANVSSKKLQERNVSSDEGIQNQ